MSSTNHDVNLILKARDEATAKLNKISGTVKTLAIGIAGYFSVSAISGFLRSSVRAFEEYETAARGISDALRSIGESADIAVLDAYTEEMMKLTTYTHDSVLASMKLGVTIAGLSGRDLTAATTAAIGLSKAFNIDLDAAMKLVSKAATGNFGAFSKLGITFKDGMTDAEKYAAVLERGAQGFQIAQGETETFSGILKQLGNAWEDAKESVGKYIAENARLKGVFQAVTFGLYHIGEIGKTAWNGIRAAMESYYNRQIERVNENPGVFKKMVNTLGTMIADLSLEYGGVGLIDKKSRPDRPLTTEGRDRWEAGLSGVFDDAMKSYEDSMKQIIPTIGSGAADKFGASWSDLMKKWDEYAAGKFGFSAAAAVAGAGMGRYIGKGEKPDITKSGFSLFESRTAGGVRRQSPESRQLDRLVYLMAEQVELTREQRRRITGEPSTTRLQLTNFR